MIPGDLSPTCSSANEQIHRSSRVGKERRGHDKAGEGNQGRRGTGGKKDEERGTYQSMGIGVLSSPEDVALKQLA